jgi:DNA-3-methyladenine glycosylase II
MHSPSTRAHRIIRTDTDIRDGVEALRRKCRVMRRVHDAAGDPPLRRRPAGFEGLARIIVGQQLSVASAGAIWGRLEGAVSPMTAAALLDAGEETLERAGLSRPKIRTLTAAASAVADGRLRLERLARRPDAAIHATLTEVSGIGPWTADIFIMFCLGRADGFAAGDLALQVAAQKALGIDARPTAAELLEIAERWRPWRGVAARLLWAYYAAAKAAKPAMPV